MFGTAISRGAPGRSLRRHPSSQDTPLGRHPSSQDTPLRKTPLFERHPSSCLGTPLGSQRASSMQQEGLNSVLHRAPRRVLQRNTLRIISMSCVALQALQDSPWCAPHHLRITRLSARTSRGIKPPCRPKGARRREGRTIVQRQRESLCEAHEPAQNPRPKPPRLRAGWARASGDLALTLILTQK